jgi:CMP-N,N'-diacetyllegionaminic acid synthase
MMKSDEVKILGITLARGGSKSVLKKNIKPICGKPLIAYTISEALKSKYISRYIVSTDDEEIGSVAQNFGADVPFIRPAELATDTASSADAIKHAVNYVENEECIQYDYIIELMCTNPLKNVEDIDACISKLIDTDADSVIAVHKLEDHHPIRIKKIEDDRIVDFCLPEVPEMRRQDLKPDAYIRSGSIYALRRDELMINNRRFGSTESRPYTLPPERAVNVDTEIDFLVAESLIKKINRS